RIETLVDALRAIGVRAKAHEEGFSVTGVPARPKGGKVDSRGDHRIAMLGAVAGLASREGVELQDAESVGVSFPGFFDLLAQLPKGPREFGKATRQGPASPTHSRQPSRPKAVRAMIVAIDGP